MLDLKGEKIFIDIEGYNQFIDELERLKLESLSIATRGSEEAKNAVGDGWHDNFAFEESMRESRTIASKINKMMEEKQILKVINKTKLKEEFVNIDDVIKLEIIYSEDDKEEEIVQLTGKYMPNTENDIHMLGVQLIRSFNCANRSGRFVRT